MISVMAILGRNYIRQTTVSSLYVMPVQRQFTIYPKTQYD